MSARKTLAALVSACFAVTSMLPVLPAAAQPLRLAPSELVMPDAGVTLVKARPKVRAGRAVRVRPGRVGRPVVRPGRPIARPGVRPGRPLPRGAWGPGRYRPGWGWYRPGWGWGYYNNTGAWIAAGVAAAAIGAAAASAANSNANADAIAYCSRRYQTYDPNTGTFMGNDGRRHSCP